MTDPTGGRYVHLDRPDVLGDSLAGFAARAEADARIQSLPLVSITIEDKAGNRFEYEALGYADLIRGIGRLPGLRPNPPGGR